MTAYIIDPDPTTLRIGQECEWTQDDSINPQGWDWMPGVYRGYHEGHETPWLVSAETKYTGHCAHIRIKKPVEAIVDKSHEIEFDDDWDEVDKPYAMVPLGPNGEMVRVEFGQELEFRDLDETSKWHSSFFFGYQPEDPRPWTDKVGIGWGCARLPRPKRPEIADNEEVWVAVIIGGELQDWVPRHFAYWTEDGLPYVYEHGLSRHTSEGAFVYTAYDAVKTKDGTVWPPIGGPDE